VSLPMVLAPVIIAWSSQRARTAVFATPVARHSAPVIEQHDLILQGWQGMGPVTMRELPGAAVRHA
jgi:hypothetical protein